MKTISYLNDGQIAINTEISEISALSSRLDNTFNEACKLIHNCIGRVIIIGMGKSGHIGSKIAATFASTGTPAFFVHPAEAGHGDFGMITKDDVILIISNSGSTDEVVLLIPQIKRLNIPIIALTGNINSILAKKANVVLNIAVAREACPHGLAPTSSTTVTLVLGDALAIALLKAKGFTKEDFAFSHPSGSLGKRLLISVRDIMASGNKVPKVSLSSILEEAILEISAKGLGMTIVYNSQNELAGVITDGDLRRIFQSKSYSNKMKIRTLITQTPKTINENDLAASALNLMEKYKVSALVVLNNSNKIVGVIHIHQLLQNGIA